MTHGPLVVKPQSDLSDKIEELDGLNPNKRTILVWRYIRTGVLISSWDALGDVPAEYLLVAVRQDGAWVRCELTPEAALCMGLYELAGTRRLGTWTATLAP